MEDTRATGAATAAFLQSQGDKPRWESPVLDVLDVRETLNGGFTSADGGGVVSFDAS